MKRTNNNIFIFNSISSADWVELNFVYNTLRISFVIILIIIFTLVIIIIITVSLILNFQVHCDFSATSIF